MPVNRVFIGVWGTGGWVNCWDYGQTYSFSLLVFLVPSKQVILGDRLTTDNDLSKASYNLVRILFLQPRHSIKKPVNWIKCLLYLNCLRYYVSCIYLFWLYSLVYDWVGVHMWCAFGGQRRTLWTCFSPLLIRVLRMQLRFSGFCQNCLSRLSYLPASCISDLYVTLTKCLTEPQNLEAVHGTQPITTGRG